MARSLEFKKLIRILQQETRKFSPSRRGFLKKSLWSSAALGASALGASSLSACASFDRWVVGDSNQLDQEVMILGGGMAGLSAAYHLKKNKVPYRLFEASSRVGGRVQTLEHFNTDGQFAELGAEFFEASHKAAFSLCKELNLPVQEVTYEAKRDRGLYWLNGKVVGEKEFRKRLRPLVLRIVQLRNSALAAFTTELSPQGLLSEPALAAVDQQSLVDLLAPLQGVMDEGALKSFENLCVSEWGVDSKNINLLHFLIRLDMEERSARQTALKVFRVQGGMSRMVRIIAERVQGIVPGANLKLEFQLLAIREKSGGYECTFRTAKGSETIWARQVICTLPFSTLKDVDGIQSLELGLKKELLTTTTYGTHSKVISSFKDPIWKKRPRTSGGATLDFQGVLRGQLLGQSYWDSSRGQAGARGLLTSQRGGDIGLSTGAEAARESLQDLRCFFKEADPEEGSEVSNWSHKPFAKGSRFNVPPGEYVKYLEALVEESENEGFLIAGEHWSFVDSGTINGAIESGVAAAEKVLRKSLRRSL